LCASRRVLTSASGAIARCGELRALTETDYPHQGSMAPGPASAAVTPRQVIEKSSTGLPEATTRKILHDNPAALYRLDGG
jgi:predicted TIM-barrel fold metal-dependent hydrolase